MNKYCIINIGGTNTDLHSSIRVALGHVHVDPEDIKMSYLGEPNCSVQRLRKLNQLLNDVLRHGSRHKEQKIHLLVLPEVFIPHSFASYITKWSREHQIGIVCGLEHRVDRHHSAWNELLAVLPYIASNGVHACVPVRRLKRHYAPEEIHLLDGHDLTIPNKPESKRQYQLFRWRGASFAIYNCYELASIEDRAIFKSKVDFIIASEFNPDVNYFSNIVESASRDLHCYVVQVNSSQFGDSRVVSPSNTRLLTPLQVKGGDNQAFLSMTLPLQKLRDHQRKKYSLQKESDDYKPTPPGFDRKQAKLRIALGKP